MCKLIDQIFHVVERVRASAYLEIYWRPLGSLAPQLRTTGLNFCAAFYLSCIDFRSILVSGQEKLKADSVGAERSECGRWRREERHGTAKARDRRDCQGVEHHPRTAAPPEHRPILLNVQRKWVQDVFFLLSGVTLKVGSSLSTLLWNLG